MFANARMYSVDDATASAWRDLLSAVIEASGAEVQILDYPAPAPLDDLWQRTDQAAVFMCGLPFARAAQPPEVIAAPVPAAPEFGGRPEYFSEFVVRSDDEARSVADTYGRRLAFTVPNSQSGCGAALRYFMAQQHAAPRGEPLFAELIAPAVTPLGALSAVAGGAADVAPIDAYALRLLARYRPELTRRVRVVGRTAATPIPLLVASHGDRLSSAFLALHETLRGRELLGRLELRQFVRPDAAAYSRIRLAADAAFKYWRGHALAARVHPAFALDLSGAVIDSKS